VHFETVEWVKWAVEDLTLVKTVTSINFVCRLATQRNFTIVMSQLITAIFFKFCGILKFIKSLNYSQSMMWRIDWYLMSKHRCVSCRRKQRET